MQRTEGLVFQCKTGIQINFFRLRPWKKKMSLYSRRKSVWISENTLIKAIFWTSQNIELLTRSPENGWDNHIPDQTCITRKNLIWKKCFSDGMSKLSRGNKIIFWQLKILWKISNYEQNFSGFLANVFWHYYQNCTQWVQRNFSNKYFWERGYLL